MTVTQGYFTGSDPDDSDLFPDDTPGLEGEVLAGRYRIERLLGQGGMATVYIAEHIDIGRRCAVKVLGPAYAGDPEAVERFLREARATSKIRHPNVIEITDFGRTHGTVFFVMELLDGEDLLACITRRGRIPWPETKLLLLQICRALAAAHARDIVHRDLKPENCFCVAQASGEPLLKVLDFGIAKVNAKSLQGQALTQLGRVFGTPAYMSPEQADGQVVDLRTDVYSLGVTMFHMLTGEVPFPADTAMGFLKQHMFAAPPSPRSVAPDAQIPPEVEAIVLKSLQKDPALRFQSMTEFAAAITAVGSGGPAVVVVREDLPTPPNFVGQHMGFRGEPGAEPATGVVSPPRRSLWLGLAGVLLVVAAAGWWALGRAPQKSPEVETSPTAIATPPTQPPREDGPEVPATPAVVAIHFATAVAAQVYDATTDTVIGHTEDPAGVAIAASEQPCKLVLRADGYEDAAVTVTPNREQTIEVTLRRRRKKAGAKSQSGPSLAPVNPFKSGKQSKSGTR